MVNQFTVTPRVSTKEKLDSVYVCSWEKLKGKTPLCIQMECIGRTYQDWSKNLPTYKSFNAFSRGYQTNFGGRIIAAKRRSEALPATQTEIPREHVTVKFRDEDAEAVIAKALEGGSGSEKEEPLFPEATEIPALLETPVEAMKRDGGERKPSGEETPSKKKARAFPSTSLPAGQPNPMTPILSSLRSPSALPRPRDVFELLEEESPMKKVRLSDDSGKNAKINVMKVGGEDLYRESSPVAEEVDEEEWGDEEDD